MRTQLTTTPASTGRPAAPARALVRLAYRARAAVREMNYAAGRIAEPRVTGR